MLNMLYPTKNVCYFKCEPLWASPYLVGLLWYALSGYNTFAYHHMSLSQKFQRFLPITLNPIGQI